MKKCPNCENTTNYGRVVENAIVIIPFEEFERYDDPDGGKDVHLHEEGDKIETLYCNAGKPYFQCLECGWVLPSKTIEEAIGWLKNE